MKKYISFVIMLALILGTGLNTLANKEGESEFALSYNTENEFDTKALSLMSKSAILIEPISGRVLYEKNADEALRPASVTKIMTLLLIFDEIANGNMAYEDMVTVSQHAASMGGSQCFFEMGEQQTVRDMIKCIEIASGNDAAVAMAEHIAGSETAFVEMMNERAKNLGMKNTHFVNACGLEAEGHLTSARDIAIMSRELLVKYPEITEFSTIWMDSIIHKTARGESRFDLANTNKFLNQYTGATGLKTGYTSQAGFCMSATASRNGISLIAVIMGADTKEIRNSEAGMLLDYGFAKCKTYTDSSVLPENLKIKVKGGVSKYVQYKPCEPHSVVVVDGNPEKIEKTVSIYNDIVAPVRKGDIVGVVQYSYDGKLLDEVYIYSEKDVEELTYRYCIKEFASRIFMSK